MKTTALDALKSAVYAYYTHKTSIPLDASAAFDRLNTAMLCAQSIALDPMRLECGIVRLRRIVEIWTKLESADERDGFGFRESCKRALDEAMMDALATYGDVWEPPHPRRIRQ